LQSHPFLIAGRYTYGSLWWQMHQIESLSEQKAELEANVVLLENAAEKSR